VIKTLHIRECISEFTELLALQRLSVEIPDHIITWAIYNCNVSFLNLIREKEITDVQCLGPLPGAFLAICFQRNCTLVVLVQYVAVDLISLFL
jgi:hypothetical protein